MSNKQTIHRGAPDQQQPPIQSSPSAGVDSLAYSIDSSQDSPLSMQRMKAMGAGMNPADSNTNDESREYYSAYSDYQYQEQQQQAAALPTVDEYHHQHNNNNTVDYGSSAELYDATEIVHGMHRKLLQALSHPQVFADALIWESKVDRGLDPSLPDDDDNLNQVGGGDGGIKSFNNSFETGVDEHKEEVEEDDDDGEEGGEEAKLKEQKRIAPPLPLQIFTPDAEVVLPQALTATQLFGMERVTGIELEAAAGITGLSHLFLRWLALMPEGDHMNIVNPPGLTVMRISGGRYRVTAAHRVVWRWMNKFSFSDAMFQGPSESSTGDVTATASGEDDSPKDTDFDFGDLVTMTIIDVFETDVDGRLLSYCPTFDNRAVHKTQESIERIRKGASQFKERMEVVAKTPAGQSAAHAAEDLRKKGLSAAFKGFNLVKNRIENEIHKHQHPKSPGNNAETAAASTASSDAVGGEDIGDEASEREEASPEGGRGVEV